MAGKLRLGVSVTDPDKVYAGTTRGITWLRKQNITQSFIETVIRWVGWNGARRVITCGDEQWTLTIVKRKPKKPAAARKARGG